MRSSRVPAGAIPNAVAFCNRPPCDAANTTGALDRQSPLSLEAEEPEFRTMELAPVVQGAAVVADWAPAATPPATSSAKDKLNHRECAMFLFRTPVPARLAAVPTAQDGSSYLPAH